MGEPGMANSECRWKSPEQWSDWSAWLSAGLHARNRWRLPVRWMGMLLAGGVPTGATWVRGWGRFATKLQLAARLVEWIVTLLKQAGKTVWLVIDGGYTKRPFLRRALKTGVTIVGRLRKDAALRDVPPKLKRGARRGRG